MRSKRAATKDLKAVKTVKSGKKVTTIPKKSKVVPNIIYIGHLPKDCEERELIGFLKQFGPLVQIRVCRSHRTGGSKGYAFCKFQTPAVASIVAETLNGHLLFQKRLVSHVLTPEQIHGKLFTKNTRTVFQRKIALKKSTTSPEEKKQRLLEREQKKRDKLKAMGIDFDFPGYEASLGGSGGKTTTKPASAASTSKTDVKKDKVVVAEKKSKIKEIEKMDDTPKSKPKSQRKRSLSGDSKDGDTDDTPKTKSRRKRSLSGDSKEDSAKKTAKGEPEERPQSEKKPKKSKKKDKKHSRKSVP